MCRFDDLLTGGDAARWQVPSSAAMRCTDLGHDELFWGKGGLLNCRSWSAAPSMLLSVFSFLCLIYAQNLDPCSRTGSMATRRTACSL